MFFFWILIYIEKEGMMKISCNRVSCYFGWVLFTTFTEDFCQGFLPGIFGEFLPGIFAGFLSTSRLGVFGVFGIYMVT